MNRPFPAYTIEKVVPLPRGEETDDASKERQAAPPVTEDAVALAFTQEHRDRLRYDHDVGAWFEWDGARWVRDETRRAFHFCRELARHASQEHAKQARQIQRAAFASGVERFAQADPAHAVRQDIWDRDPFLVGAPNVTIDLRNGQTRTPEPTDGITKSLGVAPTATSDCPRWNAFLEEATGGDQAMIRFLQRWAGYTLTGNTSEHKLMFVYGPGGNGKSVFLNVLTAILGDYAATASMDAFTASRSDRHPTDLAMLRGARLVTASETEEGRAWAESRIKSLTGGDRITARFMRQDFFTYVPQFKLTIVGNHKPVLRNVDDAARRRFLIVPFTQRPTTPDPRLEEKLRDEWGGILRWMIEGCIAWQGRGLMVPDTVTAATADYFSAQDILGQWIEDECEVAPGNKSLWATSAALFEDWQRYAQAAGENPGSQKTFGEALLRRGFTDGRKKIGRPSRVVRVRYGIRLALKADDEGSDGERVNGW